MRKLPFLMFGEFAASINLLEDVGLVFVDNKGAIVVWQILVLNCHTICPPMETNHGARLKSEILSIALHRLTHSPFLAVKYRRLEITLSF